MFAFWAKELLEEFHEADPSFAIKPDMGSFLVKPQETVAEFQKRTSSLSVKNQITELQKHLLSGLRNAEVVGRINGFWEHSMYTQGYTHADTVRLAYL